MIQRLRSEIDNVKKQVRGMSSVGLKSPLGSCHVQNQLWSVWSYGGPSCGDATETANEYQTCWAESSLVFIRIFNMLVECSSSIYLL